MSDLIAGLAGAPQAASATGNFYTQAGQNDINAAGSPAATDFLRLQNAALRPQFAANNAQIGGQLSAMGLGQSGAGRSLGGSVASNEANTLAGAAAPLYQQALSGYNQVNSQMPGAQSQSYNDAMQQFYQALSMAGSAAAGIPPSAGGAPSGGGYDSNNNYYSNTPQNAGAPGAYNV